MNSTIIVKIVLFFSFSQILFTSINANLIGYDCGNTNNLNLTTISLLDVDHCEIPRESINVTNVTIQLLQINDYSQTKVIQCKVEIQRSIHRCGMFSHTSSVANGNTQYIYELDRNTCTDMHEKGEFNRLENVNINGLKKYINGTYRESIRLAGTLDKDGNCRGSSYKDPYGSWESVAVEGTVTISLKEYQAKVSLDNDLIHLSSGITCSLTSESCVHFEEGYTFWKAVPTDNCNFDRTYSVLYEGNAVKMINYELSNQQTIYSASNDSMGITFALTATTKQLLTCTNTYEFIRTEHPKLLIYEPNSESDHFVLNNPSADNVDILTYVNSKFVYVEKHIKRQMKELYRDVIEHNCNLERQVLKNSLSIAAQNPDEFAYNLMKGPGYTAVVAGEVVHLIKCVPVEVKISHVKECYMELPVLVGNETYYLTPKTHILKSRGMKSTCNSVLPAYFLVGTFWYQILHRPIETVPPIMLKPMTRPTWKYSNPGDLMKNGIFNNEDLKKMRDNVMFPMERESVLNDFAREMGGQPSTKHEVANNLYKIMKSSWGDAWTGFLIFGTASSGIIAIFMIFQIIKTTIDVIVRIYILYTEYGFSLHLLGAIWSSFTTLLIYRRKKANSNYKKYNINKNMNFRSDGKEPYFIFMPNTPYTQMNLSDDKNINIQYGA